MVTQPENKKPPHPVDVHVGARIRQRRSWCKLSQEKLGTRLGITFQQVQKYERGANRIGASRLFEIAAALGVTVSYFYEEVEQTLGGAAPGGLAEGQEPFDVDPFTKRETQLLVRAYYSIEDHMIRRRILDLARSLSEDASPTPAGAQPGSAG